MENLLAKLKQLAAQDKTANKVFFKKLSKKQKQKLDDKVHELHYTAFEHINCLDCANCCKTLGPRLTNRDIEKLSKATRLKTKAFIAQYLRIDEDGDYVFKEIPCPFLAADNYCMVYENRPKACSAYPHTNRKRFYQIANLSIENSSTCPAVYNILKALREDGM